MGGTYNHTYQRNFGPNGDGAASLYNCANPNDDYVSTSNPQFSCDEGSEGSQRCWRTNVCRTATYIVPPPTGLAASCPAPGTAAPLSWEDSGADHYAVRLDDTSTGWTGGCLPSIYPDACADIFGTSYSASTIPSHTYSWWAHSVTSTDYWSAARLLLR